METRPLPRLRRLERPQAGCRQEKQVPAERCSCTTWTPIPPSKTTCRPSARNWCKDLVATLAKAIKNGRTTPGPIQPNEGHPNTFSQKLLAAFPALGQ